MKNGFCAISTGNNSYLINSVSQAFLAAHESRKKILGKLKNPSTDWSDGSLTINERAASVVLFDKDDPAA